MSTKIYYGFEFVGVDMHQIHQHLMEFREELAPLVKEKCVKRCMWKVVSWLDRLSCGLKTEPESFSSGLMVQAHDEMRDEFREFEDSLYRNPLIDYTFDISILFGGGKILGIPFVEQRDFRELWLSKPFIAEYGYWNNTDRLEGLTQEEWDVRGDVWEEALPGVGVPAMCGFTAQLVDAYYGYDIVRASEVLEVLPSLDERVKYLVSDVIRYEHMQNECDEITVSNVCRVVAGSERWLRTEEGQEVFKKKAEELIPLFINPVTKEVLLEER